MKKEGLVNKKILITGVSSGIGRALTKELIKQGGSVFGIARRENLLSALKKEVSDAKKYFYCVSDLTKKGSWEKIIFSLKRRKFIPDIVIFNAAILKHDLDKQIDLKTNRELFESNYFSILKGVNNLLPLIKQGSQIIAISSSSSIKGSGSEGVGYAASKAALSISFESLQQKFKNKFRFKIVFFGPVKTGMNPFVKHSLLTTSEDQAVSVLIKAINSNKVFFCQPRILFMIVGFTKLISQRIYFLLLDIIDSIHLKNRQK